MYYKLSDYARFYKLAKKRRFSNKNYLEFESQQAKMVVSSLKKKGINFKDLLLLDLGSGRGGYSREFSKNGSKVISVDITDRYFQKIKKVNFLFADARKLPFKNNTFNFIFCSGMIEHIKEQEKIIKELSRILKPKGICYLSFPPFWSPVGSHQFKPFHYFGEKIAIKLSRLFYNVKSSRYDDGYGMLYITKIKDIKRLIKKSRLKIKEISTRFSPINFAKIPFFNEFLTWHVEFLLEKRT